MQSLDIQDAEGKQQQQQQDINNEEKAELLGETEQKTCSICQIISSCIVLAVVWGCFSLIVILPAIPSYSSDFSQPCGFGILSKDNNSTCVCFDYFLQSNGEKNGTCDYRQKSARLAFAIESTYSFVGGGPFYIGQMWLGLLNALTMLIGFVAVNIIPWMIVRYSCFEQEWTKKLCKFCGFLLLACSIGFTMYVGWQLGNCEINDGNGYPLFCPPHK